MALSKGSRIVCILSVTLMLFGCSKGKEDFIDRGNYTPPNYSVSDEENNELLSKYNKHKENAELAFKTYSECEASCFEYSVNSDGICIDKYIGGSSIVVIPERIDGSSVNKIGDRAFEGSDVVAVYVPDSVEIMGFGVFDACKSLRTLRIPFIGDGEDNKNGGYIFGASEYASNGVNVPGSLTMIILGDATNVIYENAFYGFKSLEAVVLPESVKYIEKFAFSDCRSLVYISLPKKLYEIEEYAFENCSSLYILDIPSSVESIGLGAFMNCSSLKHMSVPFVGQSRDDNRFFGYIFGSESREWNSSFVPQSLTHIKIEGDSIDTKAFFDCPYILSVDIALFGDIGISAFEDCVSLREVSIGQNVENICEEAFDGCISLESITFKEGSALEKIYMQAFMNCKSLKEICLPESLKHIGRSAFYGCASLESISASSIEKIEAFAFGKCANIKNVNGINKSCIEQEGNQSVISALE